MKKLFLVLFCVSLPIFLMLFSYRIALFFTSLDANQEDTVNYLQNQEELSLNYTAAEVSHLEDVKSVMGITDYLFYFSLLIVTLILTASRKDQEQIKRLLFYGGITTVIVLGMILLFSLTAFDLAFTLFHNLFFPQGNWTFPSDSLLIRTFPLGFFMGMSYKIFLLSLGLGMGILVIGKINKEKCAD
ncbi:MAG TPA: DUF1461 domain-containing protein [Candidatus Nanoarchaeia archaeon]|nr:DUF1461 domain-containing protein [Candidatus Nanoarchaeia archaeon]